MPGHSNAIGAHKSRASFQLIDALGWSSALRTSSRTAARKNRRPMRATSGRQTASRSTGRPTTTVTGFGFHPGAGPGLTTAPWGFAPFHYGRWATFGGRWCWVPGPRSHRPVYAPALVAWVGGAPVGASAAFGGGAGVAWFPLGPREVYVPAYPVSQTYVRNINISNTTVNNTYITNVYNHNVRDIHYVNRNAPGAITAVSQTTFTSAQPVGRNAVRLSRNELAAATASTTTPPITPARQSVLGGGATGRGVRRPPPALQNRQVLAKTTPPPAPRALRGPATGDPRQWRQTDRALGTGKSRDLRTRTQVRMTAPAASAESRSGMNRAARPAPALPSGDPAWRSRDRLGSTAVIVAGRAGNRPSQRLIDRRRRHRPSACASARSGTRCDRPSTAAPVVAPPSIVRPPVTPQPLAPQREAQPPSRGDRPSGAFQEPRLTRSVRSATRARSAADRPGHRARAGSICEMLA